MNMKKCLLFTVLLGVILLKQSSAKPLGENDIYLDEDGENQRDFDVEKRIITRTNVDLQLDTLLCIFTFRNCS